MEAWTTRSGGQPIPEFARAVAALGAADRVVVATHENPDGDAIGSLVAAAAGLRQLGKEVRTYLEPCSSVPSELRLLDVSGLERHLDPGELGAVDAARRRLRHDAPAGARPRGAWSRRRGR